MRSGNIFSPIPEHLPREISETLAGTETVRVERIVSEGHASPEGFWYDQDENEWVLLLEGGAALRFEGEDEPLVLKPGDWIDIPAHAKHRVEWTHPSLKTVWVAVFYHAGLRSGRNLRQIKRAGE